MWPNPQETADLVTFAEEIFNGKLHFLCSDIILLHLKQFLDCWYFFIIFDYPIIFYPLSPGVHEKGNTHLNKPAAGSSFLTSEQTCLLTLSKTETSYFPRIKR